MKKIPCLMAVCAAAVATTARGQEPAPAVVGVPPPSAAETRPPAQTSGPPLSTTGGGLEAESLPAEEAEDFPPGIDSLRRLGPTPVSDVRFLMDQLRIRDVFGDSGIRSFGWIESGYTGASTGAGLLSVEPRQNRFGNEYLVNQIGLVLQKPLHEGDFNIGFNIRYFAGADAALGQPKGGIGSTITSSRFSQDFRDLYLSAHLPILTERGVDVKVGRMNSIWSFAKSG